MPRPTAEWLKLIAQYVKPISLSNGRYKAEFFVTEHDLNTNGRFHDGLTASLVDVVSSYALYSHGNGHVGVSTNIHITHYQPALLGDVLSIDANVYRVDHPLAYVEVEISKKNGEGIVARGQHTLFVKPADSKDNKP